MIAVIEYRSKDYSPPDHHVAWTVQATVTHAAGVVLATTRGLLADIRTALEEAGLDPHGEAVVVEKRQHGRWLPLWREVWRGEEEQLVTPAPAPTSPPVTKKPREDILLALARRAEQKHPELTTRALNAAEIVRAGLVSINGSPTRFTVQSQSGKGEYQVDTEAQTCTCADHRGLYPHKAPEINGAPLCKHRLACLMMVKLRGADAARIHAQEKRIAALQAGAMLI